METIKNAASSLLGYGTTTEQTTDTQSGAEPVSGQKGAGTAGEPFDAGNEVDDATLGGAAAQNTGASHETGIIATSSTPPVTPGDTSGAATHQANTTGGSLTSSHSTTSPAATGSGLTDSTSTGTTSHDHELGERNARDIAASVVGAPLNPNATTHDAEDPAKSRGTSYTTGGDSTTGTGIGATTGTGSTTAKDELAYVNPVKSTSSSTGPSSTTGATSSSTPPTTSGSATSAHPTSDSAKPSSIPTGSASGPPTTATESGSSIHHSDANKALPSTPATKTSTSTSGTGTTGSADDYEESGTGGKKKLSDKIKDKLHLNKDHHKLQH